MKPKHFFVLVAVVCFLGTGHAQVLNRLKNKAESKGEQKAGQAIDNLFNGKKKDQGATGATGTGQGTQGANGNGEAGSGTGSSGSGPSNKGGGGLVSTPPDVKQNLADAEVAYKKSSYGEAR